MQEPLYTITFNEEIVLTNLKLNGNNFISSEPVPDELINSNLLRNVIVSSSKDEENHQYCRLIKTEIPDVSVHCFIILDVDSSYIEQVKIWAEIDYLGMVILENS